MENVHACVRKISKEGSMKNGCKKLFLTLLVTLIGGGQLFINF